MEKAEKPQNFGTVYFIGSPEGGDVKIGFTAKSNVKSRLQQLQTGSSTRYVVLGQVQTYPEIEKVIHHFLGVHRIRQDGEWFQREAALAILNRIQNLGQNFGSAAPSGLSEKLLVDTEFSEVSDEEQPLHQWLARHLIIDYVHRLRETDTELPLPLRAWLLSQKHRDHPIGDLASDFSDDESFPDVESLSGYLIFLRDRGARSEVVSALLDAWIECHLAVRRLPLRGDEIMDWSKLEGNADRT